MKDSSLVTPNSDFLSLNHAMNNSKKLGSVSTENPLDLLISEEFEKGSPEYISVYIHENTHVKMLSVTSFGQCQQLLAQVLSGFREAGVPKQLLNSFAQAEALMYEISWMVHEGAAVLNQYCYRNSFSAQMLDEELYSSLDTRYANSALLFAKTVGSILPVQAAQFAIGASYGVARFCLQTSAPMFWRDYFSNFMNLDEEQTASYFCYYCETHNNPQLRLFDLISSAYSDTQSKIPNKINQKFMKSLAEQDLFSGERGGDRKLELKTPEQYNQVLSILEVATYQVLMSDVLPAGQSNLDQSDCRTALEQCVANLGNSFPFVFSNSEL